MDDDEDIFPDDPLLDTARLGLDVQQFQKTPGGLALVELAMGDLNDALLMLLDEPDLTSEDARRAHGRARAAHGTIDYLRQCIHAGREAERQLNEEDEHG